MAERNYDNIQFAGLRTAESEKVHTEAHDALSEAFYGKKKFIWRGKNYGILDKEAFDKLHGLIFYHLHVKLVDDNRKRATKDRVDEVKLNPDLPLEKQTAKIKTHEDEVKEKIKSLKTKGIEIDLT
jgi:hypothetical protein